MLSKSKKRKFDQTTEDEYEDGFPDDFCIDYSSNMLEQSNNIDLGQIRKTIMTSFYEAIKNGQPHMTVDLCKYGIWVRKSIISEILARFPKINYILNKSGDKNRFTITNNSSHSDVEVCSFATSFIVPLSRETDSMDIEKMASYIS